MQFCAISSCENSLNASDDISLHSFPLGNTMLLKKWVYKLKLTETNPPLSYFICDKHFQPSCFDEGVLKKDAVPSLEYTQEDFVEPLSENYNVDMKKSVVEEHIGAFLCRLCSCSLEDCNMISIFDEKKKVFEKINSCLPVSVEDCNDLPHHICDRCFKQLDRMYIIRSLAVATESLFFHHLSTFPIKEAENNQTKIESETENENENFCTIQEQLPLQGPVTCNLCDEEFIDMNKFDTHMEEHGIDFCEDPPNEMLHPVCSSCGLIFETESSYNEHKKPQKQECESCEIIFQSCCELKSHDCSTYESNELCRLMEMADDGIDYDDIENDEKLMSRSNLKKKKYHCAPCNKQFQRYVNWVKHKIKCEKDDILECKICNHKFDKLRLLNQHREKIHKNSQSWICKFCGKHTTTKLSLTIHERIHTGVKPFICEWCGNAFRSKANLSQHHAKHTGIRRHACNICGKKFSRKSFVTTHMRVHTGERPFSCDVCEQRFTQVGDMRRHRRRHIIQQQQLQQSQSNMTNLILQQVILKEEKTDNGSEIVESNVINNPTSNSIQKIGYGQKITLTDIRAHFL